MEHSRIFSNNISSTIEEIRPFIERQPGISLNSLLNIQRIQIPIEAVPLSSDNYIIDVENQSTNDTNLHDVLVHDNPHHQTTTADNFLNNIRDAANEVVGESQNNNSNNVINHNNNNNNDIEENSAQTVQISPRTRAFFKGLKRYITLVCILLAKGLYDHRTNILNFIVLIVTFNYSNNVVKREIAKQNNKNWLSLLVIMCYIIGCIIFIHFEYNIRIFSPYSQSLTIWELLWTVLITDFVLKLITIIFKVFLTCLPSKLLPLRKRGKCFVMVETASQLYRCIVPIQPWFYYLFECYQGSEKIFGVFLSLLYTVSKGTDLLSRMKLFKTAIWKLFQNVNLGISPTKEQLVTSGGICAICHDQYSMPVRLQCKHIFCETCVLTWLNREYSCPLCRAIIADDLLYRDGHTSLLVQLY
ncbi:RING finger and transmembrane domain-containing protein 2 isoform X2 [Frieseomelitta varia]|nr:RING finger and transmembrane domain-containing protein 2 isoform X2 [Frieseomelitta varia]XP_043523538.1 RING finger and transmembrane domain-containing protein 2 isoform X2 [Frieseomelitta varia]